MDMQAFDAAAAQVTRSATENAPLTDCSCTDWSMPCRKVSEWAIPTSCLGEW